MEIFRKRMRFLVDRAKNERGLSQRDLSSEMEVSHERFNKWLTSLNEPRLAHLCALARVLETHVGYLVGEDDNPMPPSQRTIESRLDAILEKLPD